MVGLDHKFGDYRDIINNDKTSSLKLVFVAQTDVELIVRDSETKYYTYVLRLGNLEKLQLEENKLVLEFSGDREIIMPERTIWEVEDNGRDGE